MIWVSSLPKSRVKSVWCRVWAVGFRLWCFCCRFKPQARLFSSRNGPAENECNLKQGKFLNHEPFKGLGRKVSCFENIKR